MSSDREAQLLSAATAAGITSPRELANFMAQAGHESNGLMRLEESFRYMRSNAQIPVQAAWREGDAALTGARLEAMQGRPERLAELMYGGRLGNDEPGDGYTYRGRGYLPLVGKDNYREAGEALGLDLVNNPDLAAEPKHAADIAAWCWQTKVPEAAREDVKAATKAINGSYAGLEDRTARFEKWEKTLTPDAVQQLPDGQANAPAMSRRLPGGQTDALAAADPLKPLDGMPGKQQHEHDKHEEKAPQSESIRKLQEDLVALGYSNARGAKGKADGTLNANTRQAIESFQREQHLNVDGFASMRTIKAVERASLAQDGIRSLEHKDHPDHDLYQQALAGVQRLDASLGRSSDQHSANTAAALTVAAKAEGMSRIDSVMLSGDGSRIFAAQEGGPLRQVAEVSTAQAVNTPVMQSSAAAQGIQPSQVPAEAVAQPGTEQDSAQLSRQIVLQQQLNKN